MANTNTYGFFNLKDIYTQRISDGSNSKRVMDAITLSVEEYNKTVNGLLDEFVERTTIAKERFELPGSGSLQPLDADGNPKPVNPSGYYDVAYPIQGAGTAWGTNRISRQMMTVEEADRFTADVFIKDADWMVRHVLAALFSNSTWTFTDEVGLGGTKGLGDLTIQPLANSDSVKYIRKGATDPATDTHYLAQANSISDSDNPFPTIKAELSEHPGNSGPIVSYVASNLVSSVQGLTEFVDKDDPDINPGANTDTLSGMISAGPGDQVLGKTKSGVWVVEWGALPSSYMIAKVLGVKPLKMREYGSPALQGLFPEFYNVDGNHYVNRFLRYCGFGASNRVAALCYRIGNSSYAVPTGYAAPIS